MGNIVKYSNQLHLLRFKKFTHIDYNIFMAICCVLKDQGANEITFSFAELKKLSNFGNHDDKSFNKKVIELGQKLLGIDGTILNPDKAELFVFFTTYIVDFKIKQVTVAINPKYQYLLNQLTDCFTSFELKEYSELNGKYTKALYMNLKQYKTTGWWNPTIEELKNNLDIADDYITKNIMRDIIKPAIKELSNIFRNLDCEAIKAKKRGAPIERFSFTFEPEEIEKANNKKSNLIVMKKNNFNNFPQNEYDFDELERLMLDN